MEDGPVNDAVTNGAMADEDKDGVIQVLCDKDVVTYSNPGQPNDTCNGKPKSSLAQVEGFLQEKAESTKHSLVQLVNEMREEATSLMK